MMPTWLVALIAGGATIWSQIKNALQWISSIILVKVSVMDQRNQSLLPYLNHKYTKLPIGIRYFAFDKIFVKSKKSYHKVAFEAHSNNMVFINKIFPLFVTADTPQNAIYGILRSITFIRGTYDINQILIESSIYSSKNLVDDAGKRFSVSKRIGQTYNKDIQEKSIQPEYGISESFDIKTYTPIGYNLSDLGVPNSDDPFANLFYTNSIIESISDIKRWHDSKKWYEEHFLNWRYGICLYGPPGTGKTSFVRALAQQLDLAVDIYDLSTMDNNDFIKAWNRSLQNVPCVVLLEDFDRQVQSTEDVHHDTILNLKKTVTIDCLLNCISGIEPADGILLAITCNDVSKLDSAFGIVQNGQSTRPGRIDKILYFGTLDETARLQMASRILSDCPEFIQQLVKEGEGDTGAQFQFRCSSVALKCYWSKDSVEVNT